MEFWDISNSSKTTKKNDTNKEKEDSKNGSSEKHENTIYFYEDIDDGTILNLIKNIKECDIDLIKKEAEFGLENSIIPIYINVNSNGGNIIDSFIAYDTILNSKRQIITTVHGLAASSATFITLAGNKRRITKNSYMLIHQLSGFSFGTYNEIKDHNENITKIMNRMKRIYKERTKLDKKELAYLINHDLYMDSEECLKKGFVDEII